MPTPTPTCAGCHAHGVYSDSGKDTFNITATTDQKTYSPGDQVTVSITGGYRPGWVRTILYDQDGNEVSRSTGPSVRGGGPAFPGPIELTAPAPTAPGTYTWSASWYGHSYQTGTSSNTFVEDLFNADHGEETVSIDSFQVIAQCDTNSPVVTAPNAITIIIPVGMNSIPASDPEIVAFLEWATAEDAEDGVLPVTQNAPPEFPVGTTPVSFFATDSCDNQGSATADLTIQVADNNLPVVTAPEPIEVSAPLCETSVPATHPDIAGFLNGATATDAEDGTVSAPITNDAPLVFPAGTVTTVTFTAVDSLGASGTATAAVTVNETTNTEPTVFVPDPVTVMVPAGTASLPVTDPAIDAFLQEATATDAEDNGPLEVSNNAPENFPVGTTSVTFSAADVCGVSANAASTITIQEENGNTPPVLNVPDQITVDAQPCETSVPATNTAIAIFLNGAIASDAEDNGPLDISNNAPENFPVGTTPVTFSVTDSNGATTTGVASVIVAGTNNTPVVIGPAPISVMVAAGTTSVPATDTAVAAFLNGATATDIQDGDLPPNEITNNAPADFPMGDTTVTFSVTDSCGMTGTADSMVTISEEQPPVVDQPSVVDPPSSGEEDEHENEIENDEHEHENEIEDDNHEHDREYRRYRRNRSYRNWRYQR